MKKIKKKNKSPESQSLFRLNSTDAPLSRREDCPLLERASQCYALIILTLFPLLHGTDNYLLTSHMNMPESTILKRNTIPQNGPPSAKSVRMIPPRCIQIPTT